MSNEHWSACLLPKQGDKTHRIYVSHRSAMDDRITALRGDSQYSSTAPAPQISLAQALYERFSLFGDANLLEESITIYRSALTIPDLNPSCASSVLDGLGQGLCERFALAAELDDISDSIRLHEQSLLLRRENGLNENPSIAGLAWSLHTRALGRLRGDIMRRAEDKKRAVQLLDDALLSPSDEDNSLLISRWCHARASALIVPDESTLRYWVNEALKLAAPGHPNHIHLLVHVAPILSLLCTDVASDHRKTIIGVLRHALDISLTAAHPWNAIVSLYLSNGLHYECVMFGNTSVMTEYLSVARDTWVQCSTDSVFFLSAVLNMSTALSSAYDITGDMSYFDEGIVILHQAIAVFRTGQRVSSPFLHNLVCALKKRYELVGRNDDLEYALRLSKECLSDSAAPFDPGMPLYVAIGVHLRLLRHLGQTNLTDLDDALKLYRDCLPILDDIDRRMVTPLGVSAIETLCAHYRSTKDPFDLYEAIELAKYLLVRTGDSTYRLEILHWMSMPLHLLALHWDDDLLAELAVTAEEEALIINRPGARMHIECLAGLARNYAALWSISGDSDAFRKAATLFKQVINTHSASPHARLQHAVTWTEWASKGDAQALSEAYHQAVSLLPEVTLFAGNWKSRLLALQRTPGLARDAAMHALTQGKVDEALQVLEQGRSVFWNQALSCSERSLKGLPSQLIESLHRVSHDLETTSAEDHISRTQKLVDELDSLVAEARSFPGYSYFLASEPTADLCAAAKIGPIIVLLANSTSAAAIILRSSDESPHHVQLPGFSMTTLEKLTSSLQAEHGFRRRNADDVRTSRLSLIKKPPKRTSDPYLDMLAQIWEQVAWPVIEALELKREDPSLRPRIFWCCSGHFSFLPLHAAGRYAGSTPECMSDYAISSYVPTVGTLLKASRQTPAGSLNTEYKSVVIVAESNTPGYAPLPETLEEATCLRNILPSSTLSDLPSDQAGIQAVLATLPTASVLHMACHGKQDMHAALDSGFVLQDGMLTLSTLMSAQTEKANFAFLSACESAMGDDKIPDEAIHLAGAMIFMGFRSVIATLWSMHDADGPKVAERVYRELSQSKCENFDYDAIPRALDAAIRELREEGVHPSRWSTWIHMGI